MPSYKLTYFAAKGRGEYIRLILIAAGQKWEENVVQFPDWPSMKAGTPWGQLPLLEVDGKQIAQTSAIVGYLGRAHGFAGTGLWEQSLADSVVAATSDIFSALGVVIFADESKKRRKICFNLHASLRTPSSNELSFEHLSSRIGSSVDELLMLGTGRCKSRTSAYMEADETKKFQEQTLTPALKFAEKFIGIHGKNGFAVGSAMTTADIALFNVFDSLTDFHILTPSILDQHPNLKGVLDKVRTHEKLNEYLKSRK